MTAASLSAQLGAGPRPQVPINHRPWGPQPPPLWSGLGAPEDSQRLWNPKGLFVQRMSQKTGEHVERRQLPKPEGTAARPPRATSQSPGGQGLAGQQTPQGPPTRGGLKACPAGALSLGLLEGAWETSQTPGGRDRVQPLALLGRAVGCWPERGELVGMSGGCFALPGGCGQALGAEMVWWARQLPRVRTAWQAVVYLYDKIYLFIGLSLSGASP